MIWIISVFKSVCNAANLIWVFENIICLCNHPPPLYSSTIPLPYTLFHWCPFFHFAIMWSITFPCFLSTTFSFSYYFFNFMTYTRIQACEHTQSKHYCNGSFLWTWHSLVSSSKKGPPLKNFWDKLGLCLYLWGKP